MRCKTLSSNADLLALVPAAPGRALPGEGVAFTAVRGWRGDPAVAVQPRHVYNTVQSRGLSPSEHLDAAFGAARCGAHPLNQPPAVAEGTAFAIAGQIRFGTAVNDIRLRRLALLKVWKRELHDAQVQLSKKVDPAVAHFARKPSLLLRLLRLLDSPAASFLQCLHQGLRDTGVAEESGIFPQVAPTPPAWSVSRLLEESRGRNEELVQRVQRSHPHAGELWAQGAEAEQTGSLGPARPLELFSSGPGGT
ncbi:unnamed protein product [Prorocentrum cordatum]|uniref:Uncharacterized protein n=1 Tax=Prorocentrum cordatum TaxID=2364126 RepID=A0ABN9WSJ9_9DINO|nr:unnamed protein product [Polarella glacialis]